jgi:hypothetical protein
LTTPLRARLARAVAASAGRHSSEVALRSVRQQRGHEARAGADLEHGLVALHLQRLQQPRLDLGLEHAGADLHRVAARQQRHHGVDEGQCLHRRRHEVFAAHGGQQVEHGRIQHLPGADLLLDHVEAGEFGVHMYTV